MAESEKGKGKAVHEIILETERGRSPVQGQINRILDEQTEMIRRQLEKSQMEQLLKESERKSKEEDFRMKKVEDEQRPLPAQPEEKISEAKTILDAVRIGVEVAKPQQQSQGSMSEMAKSLAEMFKVGVDIGRGQTQSQQPQQNMFETMKAYHETFLKPVLDQLSSKDKEMVQMRMNQLESKITSQVSPGEYIKNIQEAAKNLGLTGATKSEIDIKLAEMGQLERLTNRKLDLDEKKWTYELENSGKTIGEVTELAKTVLSGPVGKFIENAGIGIGERLKTGKGNTQLIKIQCPNCNGQFGVNPALQTITCVHCGEVLGRAPPTSQPQELAQPEPQPVAPTPQQPQTQQPDIQQPQQTQELTQESPSNATKTTDQPPAQ